MKRQTEIREGALGGDKRKREGQHRAIASVQEDRKLWAKKKKKKEIGKWKQKRRLGTSPFMLGRGSKEKKVELKQIKS